jgi:hypothetical protein
MKLSYSRCYVASSLNCCLALIGPTVSGYQIATDAPHWNESFAMQNLILNDDDALLCLLYTKGQGGDSDSSDDEEDFFDSGGELDSSEVIGKNDEFLGFVYLPLNDMAAVTITVDNDINQMQVANTDCKDGVWYDIFLPKGLAEKDKPGSQGGHDANNMAIGHRTTQLRSSAVGKRPEDVRRLVGDLREFGATAVGRLRLRLRLVRPDTHNSGSSIGGNREMALLDTPSGGAGYSGGIINKSKSNQLVALEQLPLEDELEGYFGLRCSFLRKDFHFWAGSGSNRRAWVKELQRVIRHAEEVRAHKKDQQLLLERHKSFEEQRTIVAKSKAEIEKQKKEVEHKKAQMMLKFEIKELMDDLVARVEERITEEMPVRADGGIDEKKVQEIMKQMREVELQKEELELQKKAYAEQVKAQLEAGMTTSNDPESDGYVDWLKRKMMRAQAGMNEDELNWEYAVDNKQVGNSYLHAEEEEKKAQLDYGKIMAEKDVFDRLVALLKNHPAIAALKAASTAVDDTQEPTVGGTAGRDKNGAAFGDACVMHTLPTAPFPRIGTSDSIRLKDDPLFTKYFKMLKMHLPPPAVRQKMAADGVDPSILDMNPDGPSPNPPSGFLPAAATAATSVVAATTTKLRDDPMFTKYFKMLKMHLPPPAVRQKMAADGIDPSILDMDPDGPSPNQAALSNADKGVGTAPASSASEEEMDMFAQIRAAKARKKKAAAGGAKSSGKKMPMRTALHAVNKALNGPRGAKEELTKIVYPAGDKRFEVCVEYLQAVQDAYDARGADEARDIATAKLEAIIAAEKEYKARTTDLTKKGDVIDKEIEKWGRRKDKAPEKEAMEKELELRWANENEEMNDRCLKLMRSYIPSDIKDLVGEALLQRVDATVRALQFHLLSINIPLRGFCSAQPSNDGIF